MLVGLVNGPDVPLEVVDVLPVDCLKFIESPDILAEAAGSILLELNPMDELVDSLSVDCVLKAELVGQESGVGDSIGGL